MAIRPGGCGVVARREGAIYDMEKYQKYPYMASHPVNRIWYAHYAAAKAVTSAKELDA